MSINIDNIGTDWQKLDKFKNDDIKWNDQITKWIEKNKNHNYVYHFLCAQEFTRSTIHSDVYRWLDLWETYCEKTSTPEIMNDIKHSSQVLVRAIDFSDKVEPFIEAKYVLEENQNSYWKNRNEIFNKIDELHKDNFTFSANV